MDKNYFYVFEGGLECIEIYIPRVSPAPDKIFYKHEGGIEEMEITREVELSELEKDLEVKNE